MKLLHSLAVAAVAVIGLVTGAAATDSAGPPSGELACYIAGPSENKNDVARAIGGFCDLWGGHVMSQDTSIWNTIPMRYGGVAKFDLVYVGTGTHVIDVNECEDDFEYVIDDCNVGGEGSQGGNFLANQGTVYYLLSINPPTDQQTNGTFPSSSKRSDSKRSTSLSPTKEAPASAPATLVDSEPGNNNNNTLISRQSGIACETTGGIASYPNLISEIDSFCAMTFTPGSTDQIQTTNTARMGVVLCEANPVGFDWGLCRRTMLTLMWHCGTGNGNANGGEYLESACVTWGMYLESGGST
ncbi:hypothetical protein B0A55_12380 [Friedmanniomyces simplex]|uniref:Ecp2 effector protein domain-containing protein n=1 Tax=Friedmanniomyces simplex TaxID=329884 RepID=A0A4U0W3T0_9PEZI|nr:hypothetical protein B0A55_12380 [Friedmanniomyces simplex]